MAKPTKAPVKTKTKNVSPNGNVYVFSGYNNTIVTITDLSGNTISWGSAGYNNFKGSKKSTPYAATIVGEDVARRAYSNGLREVAVFLKGVGNGKVQCVKSLKNAGLIINKIVDTTPISHNGCRPKKRRRV